MTSYLDQVALFDVARGAIECRQRLATMPSIKRGQLAKDMLEKYQTHVTLANALLSKLEDELLKMPVHTSDSMAIYSLRDQLDRVNRQLGSIEFYIALSEAHVKGKQQRAAMRAA